MPIGLHISWAPQLTHAEVRYSCQVDQLPCALHTEPPTCDRMQTVRATTTALRAARPVRAVQARRLLSVSPRAMSDSFTDASKINFTLDASANGCTGQCTLLCCPYSMHCTTRVR